MVQGGLGRGGGGGATAYFRRLIIEDLASAGFSLMKVPSFWPAEPRCDFHYGSLQRQQVPVDGEQKPTHSTRTQRWRGISEAQNGVSTQQDNSSLSLWSWRFLGGMELPNLKSSRRPDRFDHSG